MMRKLTKRELFHLTGAGAAAYLASKLDEFLPVYPEKRPPFRARIQGRSVWLAELRPEGKVVHAQYAYYPYQYQDPYMYYGQYQMWAAGQWYQAQYQSYMQRLVQQYSWAQSYVSPMQRYMQQFSNSYSLSEPFAMESIQSIYSYGDGVPATDDLILGLTRRNRPVLAKGKPVKLMSAVSDIADNEGWAEQDKEKAAGPQSDSMLKTASLGRQTVAGAGYRTANGEAFVSARRYENQDSGETGSIVMFDTSRNKEVRLVEV
jgi:hypothetical protein